MKPLGVGEWLEDPRYACFGWGEARSWSITAPSPTTMSLTSTSNIKSQLTTALGDKAPPYFSTFQLYLKASISRQEFEDQVRESLDTPHLRASSRYLSERDSRIHLNSPLYSAIAQLTCDISV